MPDLGQIIVIVDVNAKLNFFKLRAAWLAILVVLGKIVTELSKRNDFSNWRIGGLSDFDQIESTALRFTQSVGQLHYTKLLAARSQNDPHFASANAAVYTKLWLQILFISKTTKRECAISPLFSLIAIPTSTAADPDAPWFAAGAIHRVERPASIVAGRRARCDNISILARRISINAAGCGPAN